MTEEQSYQVLSTGHDFELRRYPSHIVAEVEMVGSFDHAGNAAFRPLVSFISGRNRGGEKVAMTAPVVQQPSKQTDTHLVAFVMPTGSTVESLPIPLDAAVKVHEVPEQIAAVSRFSGRWTEKSYDDHVAALRTSVADAGLKAAGDPRYARFDPPWKPWFLRRNEVVLPVLEIASSP